MIAPSTVSGSPVYVWSLAWVGCSSGAFALGHNFLYVASLIIVADAPVSTSISTSVASRSILTVSGWPERRWSLTSYKYSGYSSAGFGACSSEGREASSLCVT